MRVYVGDHTPDGDRVWVEHRAPDTELGVAALRAELAQLATAPIDPRDPFATSHLELLEARRAAISARLVALSTSDPPPPLHHRGNGRVDGFAWGAPSDAATALAVAVLTVELGEEAPAVVGEGFALDVLARLEPSERFELPAREVWRWIGAHHDLLDVELYQRLPATHPATDPSTDDEPEGVSLNAATASALVAACEHAWADIRQHHPDLPDAVMVLGTGVERGRLVKLGHWWGGRWVADGQPRGEVLLAGEALHLPPADVFEILLHEAAHGLNAARGIKDTSRGGRYHNQRFKAAAEAVLLKVRAMPPYGLARTLLTPDATDRYGDTIERLGDVMRIARRLDAGLHVGADDGQTIEGQLGGGRDRDGEGAKSQAVTSSCGCGRKMRMAPSVLASGPVLCGLCGAEFTPTNQRAPEAESHHPAVSREAAASTPAIAVTDADIVARRAAIEHGLDRLVGASGVVDEPLPLQLAPAQSTGSLYGLTRLAPTAGELTVLADWYRHYDTATEQPMPATDSSSADRLDRLARAVLEADGTLTGPTLRHPDSGRSFQAGDRIITAVAEPTADLPAGILGTVETIDVGDRSISIDFAAYARVDLSLDTTVAALLRHDYTALAASPAVELDDPDVDLDVDLPL